MKISKKQLKKIIKEEFDKELSEGYFVGGGKWFRDATPRRVEPSTPRVASNEGPSEKALKIRRDLETIDMVLSYIDPKELPENIANWVKWGAANLKTLGQALGAGREARLPVDEMSEEKDYVRHLSTDDVENVYRELGARAPRSFRDIKNIARSYKQDPQGRARIRRDIRSGKVRGIKIKEEILREDDVPTTYTVDLVPVQVNFIVEAALGKYRDEILREVVRPEEPTDEEKTLIDALDNLFWHEES